MSGVPEICTNPLEALTIGRLNPGALLHGLVPAVAVTVGVPEIWTSPDDALRTVTVPLICTRPDDTEIIGTLNPGALDHGFVPAVEVTVKKLPLLTFTNAPKEDVTGLIAAPATLLVGVIGR